MVTKEHQLLVIMVEAYWKAFYSKNDNLAWVTMEHIVRTTAMSSFSQRFQEWRDRGIDIRNSIVDGASKYRLFTNPESIDFDNFRLKTNEAPISRNQGKSFKPDPKEEMARIKQGSLGI